MMKGFGKEEKNKKRKYNSTDNKLTLIGQTPGKDGIITSFLSESMMMDVTIDNGSLTNATADIYNYFKFYGMRYQDMYMNFHYGLDVIVPRLIPYTSDYDIENVHNGTFKFKAKCLVA